MVPRGRYQLGLRMRRPEAMDRFHVTGDLGRGTALTVTDLLRCVVGGFRLVLTTVSAKHCFVAFTAKNSFKVIVRQF